MTGYTKLFSEIIGSSIWDEDDKTRLVWITMLALKDRNQVVKCTDRALALFSRVSPEDCDAALRKLSEPDVKSKSQEHEGRRIRRVDGGWFILNGEKYAMMLSYEERKEYNRVKQAEYRRRRKSVVTGGRRDGARAALHDGLAEAGVTP